MPLPKLPRGGYAEIAAQLEMTVTQVRNHLLDPKGAPQRVQRAVDRALQEENDRKRVAGFRRLIGRGSDALVLQQLAELDRAAAKERVLNAYIESDLICGAFDYYLGRQTAAAGDFAIQTKQAWADLAPGTQHLLRRRLHQAFSKHAEQLRELVYLGGRWETVGRLGAQMDVGCWDSLRRAIAKYDATPEGQKRLAQFPGPPPVEPPAGYAAQHEADATFIQAAYRHLQGRTAWVGLDSKADPPSEALQAILTGKASPAGNADLAILVGITGPASPALYAGRASSANFAGKPGTPDITGADSLAGPDDTASLASYAGYAALARPASKAAQANLYGTAGTPSEADSAGPADTPNIAI